MIDAVNLGAEAKRFTHRRCKVLTQCQFLKGWGVGGISLIKVGKDVQQVQNLGQAKLLKETLFPHTVFMNFRLCLHCTGQRQVLRCVSGIKSFKNLAK